MDYLAEEEGLIEAFARVVSVADGVAVLEPEPKTSCGGCNSLACGTHSAMSNRLAARRFSLVTAETLAVGERVVVGVRARDLIKAALVAYAIPLATMLAGGIATHVIIGRDPVTLMASIGGLVIGFGIASWSADYLFSAEKIAPRFIRRAKDEEACPNKSTEEINSCRNM